MRTQRSLARWLLLAAMLVSVAPTLARAQNKDAVPSRTMRVLHNVPYYTGPYADPKFHVFDLFLPEGKKNFPMLFFIHGGGWRGGDKVYAGLDHIVNICIDMGMGVMSVNYRLSPAVQHPSHIQDVAKAFAWLYNNGAQYGANRDRIFVAGGSAGAHLAALLGIDNRYLKEHGIPPTAIKAVMPFSGIYDLANWYTLGTDGTAGSVASETAVQTNSAEGRLYQMVKTAFVDADRMKAASPQTYVGQLGKDTPPYRKRHTSIHDQLHG